MMEEWKKEEVEESKGLKVEKSYNGLKFKKGFCELALTRASWEAKRRVVLSKVEGKQSPKSNQNAK